MKLLFLLSLLSFCSDGQGDGEYNSSVYFKTAEIVNNEKYMYTLS